MVPLGPVVNDALDALRTRPAVTATTAFRRTGVKMADAVPVAPPVVAATVPSTLTGGITVAVAANTV